MYTPSLHGPLTAGREAALAAPKRGEQGGGLLHQQLLDAVDALVQPLLYLPQLSPHPVVSVGPCGMWP